MRVAALAAALGVATAQAPAFQAEIAPVRWSGSPSTRTAPAARSARRDLRDGAAELLGLRRPRSTRGRSSSIAASPQTSSPCSAGSTRRASRSGGCSRSPRTGAATTPRWPRTTRPPSTAVAPSARPPAGAEHAYGLAIDVNPVENPYVLGWRVLPPREGASSTVTACDRGGEAQRRREGVRGRGWGWGGRWRAPDYQHFSATGR